MTGAYKNSKSVALISTPWPLYSRPSIQLGALKAYLQSAHPGLKVDAHHFYLILAKSMGYRLYHDISERTWLAEAIYAALLFPEHFEVLEKLFMREAGAKSGLKKAGLKKLASLAKKTTDAFIDNQRWGDYLLAGFSISSCQLTSALYFIRRIKQNHPELFIVIGGSTFSGSEVRGFLEMFPEVDALINGEGELPLSELVDRLKTSSTALEMPPVKGLNTSKAAVNAHQPGIFHQMKDLSRLPTPNYDDYFNLLKSLGADNMFFPTLPLETSRGCWWQRSSVSGKTAGCAFCNLNLQWKGYRAKEPSQVIGEIDRMTAKYKTLSVSIVDNVLPRGTSKTVFRQIGKLKKDLRLFSEIRATTSYQELKVLGESGMQAVQIGIEALSTSLLKKLNKGTSVIQNLEIMKNCETLGIANISNLILHFPGSGAQDVDETLQSIDFAMPYRPLKAVGFWLGLGSPVANDPGAYGIKAVFNHPNWGQLFPGKIPRSMQFIIQTYRSDRMHQKKIWQPVMQKIKEWQTFYAELKCGSEGNSILNLRDGGDFLIIRQKRLHRKPLNHRLMDTSRSIYLFCRHHRSLKRIRDEFPTFSEDKIVTFLKMMVDKKLMFEENGRYLSLAVPVRSRQ
jgi:ribosomal peptide maturation radical SAM protein 1